MRFIDIEGLLKRGARQPSKQTYISQADLEDRLLYVISRLNTRITELEARLPPEAIEFEKDVSTGGAIVELPHNFNCPVRFMVTSWSGAATTGPELVIDSTSDSNVLRLRSYVAARAVIRVEPSQYETTP